MNIRITSILIFLFMFSVACKPRAPIASSSVKDTQQSAIPAEDQPQISEDSSPQDVLSEIGRIARAGAKDIGLFCGELRQPGYKMPPRCADYCDTFYPIDTVDKSLYSFYLTSWLTVVPESIRTKIIGWTDWIISGAGNKPMYADRIKGLSCAVVMLSYISKEIFDYNRCKAGSKCLNCGEDNLAIYAKGVSMACRQAAALSYCAATMGVTAEAMAGAVGAAGAGGAAATVGTVALGTCMAQGTGNYLLYRGQCQESCRTDLHAVRPVAQAKSYTNEKTGKTYNNAIQCCRCEVEKYEDRWGIFNDRLIESDYMYSTTFEVDKFGHIAVDKQCEGRNGTVDYHTGFGTKLRYKNCAKHWYQDRCPLNAKGSERGIIFGLDER